MCDYLRHLKYRLLPGCSQVECLLVLVLLGLLLLLGVPRVSGEVESMSVDAVTLKPLSTPKGVFLVSKTQAQRMEFNAQVYQIRRQVAKQVQTLETEGLLKPDSTFLPVASGLKEATRITDETFQVDNMPGGQPVLCDGKAYTCFKFPEGPVLFYPSQRTLLKTDGTLTALLFGVDPDGVYSPEPDNTGKSLLSFVYPTGKLTTLATEFNVEATSPSQDPDYWDPSRFN